ncbi:MAG: helix-turn-helix transcriptional regulator [Actinomycetota bacterium]|nr:helix-turn-helix transcriptional regulator [Actinomycetota bacterium]MDA2949763.1 helix-turn-helix transcriptional regulator [Actinomycetota bacterium]
MAVPLPGRFDARKLREARLALGLNQVQAAQRVGVDPSVFNSWESRGCRPSVRNLARVAAALGLSVSDLYASDSDAVGTLTDLRVKAGLTQRQLAVELGVNQTMVSSWERGLARPTPDQAGLYAVIAGCDEDTLSAAIDRPPPAKRGAKRKTATEGVLPDTGGTTALGGAPAPTVGDLGQVGSGAWEIALDLSQWDRLREVEEYAAGRSIDLCKAIRELVEHALSPPPSVPRTPRVTPGDR